MNEINKAQPQPRSQRHWGEVLKHRWPTLLGLVVAFLTAYGEGINKEFISVLSTLIIFMAFIYLAAAVSGRRSSAWLVFIVGFVIITLSKIFELNNVAIIGGFLLAALVFLMFGIMRQGLRKTHSLPLETIGMMLFAAIALVALNLDISWAGYLAVLALFGHATWDAVHLWRNRVVTRSYAEFCAVLDAVLGVAILVMLWQKTPGPL